MATGFCSRCGAPYQGGSGFCPRCGSQYDNDSRIGQQYGQGPQKSGKKKLELWQLLTIIASVAVVAAVVIIIVFSGRGGEDMEYNLVSGGRSPSPEGSYAQGSTAEDVTTGSGTADSEGSGAAAVSPAQPEGGGPSGSGVTPGSGGAVSPGGLTLDELLGSGAAVQYQRVVCPDPALGCEAVRSVAPSNWNSGGQAFWTMQSGLAPVTVEFYVESNDNTARAGWVSGMSYVQLDQSYQLADGQWHSGSVAPVKTFQDAETYAQSFFAEYTGITNLQLIDVQYPDDAMRRSIEEYIANQYAETNAFIEQMAPMAASQNTEYRFDHYADAAQVTLRFDLNGIPCRAKVFVLISATLNTYVQQLAYVGPVTEQQLHWNTKLGVYYYMAQESVFNEYEAVSEVFFSNIIVNEQWGGAVRQVSEEMFRRQLEATFEQVQQSQQAMQQYGANAVSQSSQNYYQSAIDNRGDAIHNAMDGWTNVVRGQDYFAGADGAPVLLDNSYSHTYSDGAGNFVQSNDSWDTPYGWDEVSGSSMWP